MVAARNQTHANPCAVEKVYCATRFKNLPSCLVCELGETEMRRLNDLPAQLVIHRNFDDVRRMQGFALEKLPTFEELFHGNAPHTERLGQMAIAETSLARHLL